MCIGVVSGEQFFTRDEESFNFGRHGKVKFKIRTGLIYLQDNTTSIFDESVHASAEKSAFKFNDKDFLFGTAS